MYSKIPSDVINSTVSELGSNSSTNSNQIRKNALTKQHGCHTCSHIHHLAKNCPPKREPFKFSGDETKSPKPSSKSATSSKVVTSAREPNVSLVRPIPRAGSIQDLAYLEQVRAMTSVIDRSFNRMIQSIHSPNFGENQQPSTSRAHRY